jgi:gliding motility-associated-like protein
MGELKNGCGLSLPLQHMFRLSRYFTPAVMDITCWKIKNCFKVTLYIFDRFELLKQLTVSSNGWNGTFNGFRALPADDYWFHLEFGEMARTIKGHFH